MGLRDVKQLAKDQLPIDHHAMSHIQRASWQDHAWEPRPAWLVALPPIVTFMVIHGGDAA